VKAAVKKREIGNALELRWDEGEHPRDEKGRFVSKNGSSIKDLRSRTSSIIRKKRGDYKNRSTGEVAKLTKNSIEKLTSAKAVWKSINNGFTAGQHMEIVGRVTALYSKASFIKQEEDFYGRKDVYFKKYKSNFKFKNGKQGMAYITIMNTKQNGDTFYSVELLK